MRYPVWTMIASCGSLACGCASWHDASASRASTPARSHLPPGLSVAPGSAIDPVTGLPDRCIHDASGVALVLLKPGVFTMGDPSEQEHSRAHRRVIEHALYMGETEVTVAQFRRFVDASGYRTDAERGVAEEPDKRVGAFAQIETFHQRAWDTGATWRTPFPRLPAHVARDDHPVCQVSWNDAAAFCEHYGLSLPTDAEWEYACRAGRTGNPLDAGQQSITGTGNVADASTARLFRTSDGIYSFDDGHATLAPAASYAANPWGLFDMVGNVEEWTSEWWHAERPRDGDGAWSRISAAGGEARALRGAAWISGPSGNPYVDRFGMRPFSRRDFIGFRVCIRAGAATGS